MLVSACIGKTVKHQFDELLSYYQAGVVSFCLCKQLTNEYCDVTNRPKIAKYITPEQARRFIELYHKISITYKTKNVVWFAPDPNDSYLLSLATKAQANYLVCGDKTLLKLGKFENTTLITLSELLQVLKEL